MIYLLYLAESSGIPLWKFEHPRTPDEIISNITGKDDSIIVGYLSAISHFSKATLGTQIQMMNFGNYSMYYWYFKIKDKDIIGLVICDASDKKEAVYNTVHQFFDENRKLLEEFVELYNKIPEDESNRRQIEIKSKMLANRFQEILDEKVRSFKYIANRNILTISLGAIVSFLFFLLMLELTFYLNNTMGWFSKGELGILTVVIVILDLIAPSIVLGYITGFRDGALIGGLLTGIAIVGTLTIIYLNYIEQWATQWKMSIYIYPLWIVFIFILGGAMGLMASFIAEKFVEVNTLIPPKEIEEQKTISWEKEETVESERAVEDEQ